MCGGQLDIEAVLHWAHLMHVLIVGELVNDLILKKTEKKLKKIIKIKTENEFKA